MSPASTVLPRPTSSAIRMRRRAAGGCDRMNWANASWWGNGSLEPAASLPEEMFARSSRAPRRIAVLSSVCGDAPACRASSPGR